MRWVAEHDVHIVVTATRASVRCRHSDCGPWSEQEHAEQCEGAPRGSVHGPKDEGHDNNDSGCRAWSCIHT